VLVLSCGLPSACTRLLHAAYDGEFDGAVVPTRAVAAVALERCGARVGGMVIPPDSCQGGYYGHDASLAPTSVLQDGLPARGSDWDLINHAEGVFGNSAFRGTTKLVTYPDGGGAAAWADEGGFV
jgi:hypothetical protein